MSKIEAGKFFADTAKQVARQTVGKILHVGIKPESYNLADHVKNIRNKGVKKVLKGVITGKPLYKKPYAGRETLWANSLGQKVHKKSRKQGRKALDTFTDAKGNITHHGLKPGSVAMGEVALNVADRAGMLAKGKLSKLKKGVESLTNNVIMGGYNLKVPPKGKGPATYQDKWDFAINKGESLSHYIDADKLKKPMKSNRVTRAIDKMIGGVDKMKRDVGSSKTLDKIKSGLEGAKVIASPQSSSSFAVNKARNMLDTIVKHQKIEGKLTAGPKSKLLSVKEQLKFSKDYKKAKKKGDLIKAVGSGTSLMEDTLMRSGKMQPFSAYKGPRQVVNMKVKKSKFFSVPNPKKIVEDIKSTKYEKRRAINTNAKNKVIKSTSKQHNRAIRNAALPIAQAAGVSTATGVGINALVSNNKKKKK